MINLTTLCVVFMFSCWIIYPNWHWNSSITCFAKQCFWLFVQRPTGKIPWHFCSELCPCPSCLGSIYIFVTKIVLTHFTNLNETLMLFHLSSSPIPCQSLDLIFYFNSLMRLLLQYVFAFVDQYSLFILVFYLLSRFSF